MHPGDPSSTVDYAEFTKEDSMPWNVTVNLAISPKAAKVQNEVRRFGCGAALVNSGWGYGW